MQDQGQAQQGAHYPQHGSGGTYYYHQPTQQYPTQQHNSGSTHYYQPNGTYLTQATPQQPPTQQGSRAYPHQHTQVALLPVSLQGTPPAYQQSGGGPAYPVYYTQPDHTQYPASISNNQSPAPAPSRTNLQSQQAGGTIKDQLKELQAELGKQLASANNPQIVCDLIGKNAL